MADVRIIARRAGISNAKLESKTAEYVRLVNSRLSGASLGQGELCKTAACMELASLTLDVPLDASLLRKSSGVSEQVYKNTKATLQKLLGVGSKATARDLCIQFGCARHESAVKAALTAYKERFVRRLPPAKQGHVDFGRPVFLAAVFYLVARKNKTQVDKSKLLQPLGITGKEFAEVLVSMTDLIQDLMGTAADKQRSGSGSSRAQQSGGGANRELLDATGGSDDDDEDCSSDEEEVTEEGMVGQRLNKKKQRQREFEEWKEKVMVAEAPKAKKQKLSEKSLRQATLSFAASGGKEGAASQGGKGGEPARAPGAQALQQKNT